MATRSTNPMISGQLGPRLNTELSAPGGRIHQLGVSGLWLRFARNITVFLEQEALSAPQIVPVAPGGDSRRPLEARPDPAFPNQVLRQFVLPSPCAQHLQLLQEPPPDLQFDGSPEQCKRLGRIPSSSAKTSQKPACFCAQGLTPYPSWPGAVQSARSGQEAQLQPAEMAQRCFETRQPACRRFLHSSSLMLRPPPRPTGDVSPSGSEA